MFVPSRSPSPGPAAIADRHGPLDRGPLMRTRTSLLAALLLSATLTAIQSTGAQIVTTTNPQGWFADTRATAGTVGITGANPRQGAFPFTQNVPPNGSLELTTSGGLTDWAFFRNESSNSQTGFGALSALSALSFDWWRTGGIDMDAAGPLAYEPWRHQSPVLRVTYSHLIGGALVPVGELVWEHYYQLDANGLASAMSVNAWNRENLLGQKFWIHEFSDAAYYVANSQGSCTRKPSYLYASEPVLALSLRNWQECALGENAAGLFVTGVAVGVGSQWPGRYRGYVDNVVLGFGGATPVMAANFEVVPEPSTWAMMAAGLLGVGVAVRRRRSV